MKSCHSYPIVAMSCGLISALKLVTNKQGIAPALVLSGMSYNGKTGLAVVCPVTNRAKGYPFEVPMPPRHAVTGVVLADQVRNVDWRSRNAQLSSSVPLAIVDEVLRNLAKLCG